MIVVLTIIEKELKIDQKMRRESCFGNSSHFSYQFTDKHSKSDK